MDLQQPHRRATANKMTCASYILLHSAEGLYGMRYLIIEKGVPTFIQFSPGKRLA